MLEIERIKGKISNLTESEAKSLLLMFYARLDTAINGTGGDEVVGQTVKDLFEIYKGIPDNKG